ncbi:MAG: hypothetical protein LBJ91_03340 [Clostridiales Family XIII bacterium]|jgi:hypothetical protein|nr:hypothetical protein [Clostridiales Family XIII bacterium]
MKRTADRRFLAVVCAMLLMTALASCGLLLANGAGASGAGADDEDYDFSVFFGHAEDPITVGRIVLRYKAETGVSIRPITTDEDAADGRLLARYLGGANPPAAFAMPSEVAGIASGAGIGWRFHGRGFAADRRVLADLIGAADAGAPEVDAFVEDLRMAGYGEWRGFIDKLDAYIDGAGYAAGTLNGKAYTFAGTKGRFSSQLNGIFAVSGAEPSFVGVTLMDLASATSNNDALGLSRLSPTPQAFTSVAPVLDTYAAALEVYTSHIAGRYASGVRGDDFISPDIYSPEYTGTVFAEHRAVFMPFDSEDYAVSDAADATQAGHIAILPVKMPYAEHWLSGYLGAVGANKSIQLRTEYSLCVNEQSSPSDTEAARAFIAWLLADTESTDAVQLGMTAYHESGSELPLLTGDERDDEGGMAAFGEEAYDGLLPMLSDPEWLPDEIKELRGAVFERWLSSG